MLSIWETSCSSFISEMPELIGLNREFNEKGGQIVGLVFDAVNEDQTGIAKEIIEEAGIDFPTILPNEDLLKTFDAMVYPITCFVNDKGEILGKPLIGAGIDEYRETMETYLSNYID